MARLYFYFITLIRITRRTPPPVFVFGVPRGGTTWFAEYLAEQMKAVYVHEPFGIYNPKVKNAGYRRFEYFSDDRQRRRLVDYLQELIDWKFDRHVIRSKELLQLLFRSRLVIKFIKGSSMINEFAKSFPESKFVLLVRSPETVVRSQVRYGDLEQFYSQQLFDNPTLSGMSHNGKYIELPTPFHKLAYSYGINYTGFKSDDIASNVKVVAYEDFVKNPKRTLQDLSLFFGEEVGYDIGLFQKPSSSTNSGQSAEHKQLMLTNEEKKSIRTVLTEMDVAVYKDDELNRSYFDQ